MLKYQLKAVAQQKEPISILSAKATSFTPKGKQKQVSYANIVKQDPKDNVSRPNSPLPFVKKKRKTVLVFKANNSKTWGQVVAIKFKLQQKYIIVTISIELNQEATRLWNDEAILIKGVTASVITATLYLNNPTLQKP
ncbi:hypothetical protein RhiirA5_425683 [Rhizophagus irregularis]|uniref:Uncharacterized protein n=1 Tax=Rhizophagus irregularis TaxID=588596 RepID=A0A2I1F3R6_9GLOM|nr:hypothetical protein RhiirA5_425683 [Rhizophagus irregularis]PKC52865.1 hypothetical protein RhiirA1_480508 [Rhizophagus irregularis]PKY29022.1 hypothetical protein RhiirB3_445468 [Rhizophagus irregularis]